MGKLIDLTGKRFTRLEVIKRTQPKDNIKDKHAFWLCKCDCGKDVIAPSCALLRGDTKSCGCYSNDIARERCLRLKGIPKKKNIFIDCGNYYKGYTSKNEEFLFDKDIFDVVSKSYWRSNRGYIYTGADNTASSVYIALHHLVMGKPTNGKEIDHINRNPSDNRRENLRVVTHLENMQNLSKNKTNTSGVSNVYYNKQRNKYFGRFRYNNKIYYTKFCDNMHDAEINLNQRKEQIKKDLKGE